MLEPEILIDGVAVPRLLYGTAWKEDSTQRLTEAALREGFRGIDTANQRQHYDEAGVGRAIATSLESGAVKREDLFVQTKFTFRPGQDHRLPYDPSAPIAIQVEQSFASSLQHLGVDTIDSYLLHGPSQRTGLTQDDWDAWRAMERLHDSEHVRLLGVSNIDLNQLRRLFDEARVKPRVVQNRCYAVTGWDRQIREFCAANEVVYQGFSLLTANAPALNGPPVAAIAKRHNRTVPQVIFRFALQIGMVALTGTTIVEHIREDLDVFRFSLKADEVEVISHIAAKEDSAKSQRV